MLPLFQSTLSALTQMQTRWKSELDPVLNLPTSSPVYLRNVPLVMGSNVINHRLGRTPQGWVITDINASAEVYRNAPFNDLTLTLVSSAPATVSLMIF